MSSPIDFGQRLELRDTKGVTVGIVLPEPALRELIAERDALQKQVAELREEVAALRAEVAQGSKERSELEQERDEYRQALSFLTREDVAFDPREFVQMQKGGVPFEQVIRDIEEIVGRKPPGG